MKKNKIVNVILSGGSGTRLWPLSRKSKPKQFLRIFDDKSLFQHTVERNKTIVDEFMLITNESQTSQAEKQLKTLDIDSVQKIIEPVGRNTAPAIALAALSLSENDILLVTPSDHMISDTDLYEKSMLRAFELAKENNLVTFGIRPTEANTGFGYIEYKNEDVISFREKPDKKTAEFFLEKGNFSWNSGMFCFKASVFLTELKKHNIKMFNACKKTFSSMENGVISLEDMMNIPSDSIDYAVLEKSDCIKTVSANFKWTDLGTFDAIINYFEEGNNVSDLQKEPELLSYSFSNKKIFTNIENLIIVNTEDSIVVLERNNPNDIKSIYNKVVNECPKLIE